MREIHHGKNTIILPEKFAANFFSAIVCDPPYGLKFMDQHWDYEVPSVEEWRAHYRVLKPGGYLLAFGGTRTYHRMVCNIEDAGFEIKDQLQWIYGSGFPKALDISKAIDARFGAERSIVGKRKHPTLKDTSLLTESKSAVHSLPDTWLREWDLTAPATELAKQWEGWKTALKPANEPIVLAQKPISERTIAQNILKWGTGAMYIDGCRIPLDGEEQPRGSAKRVFAKNGYNTGEKYGDNTVTPPSGRYPANVMFDEEAAAMLDAQAPRTGAMSQVDRGNKGESSGVYGDYAQKGDDGETFYDDGLAGASRFFYCAKTSRAERNIGLDDFESKPLLWSSGTQNPGSFQSDGTKKESANNHKTVKPVKLMQWLVRLVTPPGGIVLDGYAGSGSTGMACEKEGFDYVLIEQEEPFCSISRARTDAVKPKFGPQLELFSLDEKKAG